MPGGARANLANAGRRGPERLRCPDDERRKAKMGAEGHPGLRVKPSPRQALGPGEAKRGNRSNQDDGRQAVPADPGTGGGEEFDISEAKTVDAAQPAEQDRNHCQEGPSGQHADHRCKGSRRRHQPGESETRCQHRGVQRIGNPVRAEILKGHGRQKDDQHRERSDPEKSLHQDLVVRTSCRVSRLRPPGAIRLRALKRCCAAVPAAAKRSAVIWHPIAKRRLGRFQDDKHRRMESLV